RRSSDLSRRDATITQRSTTRSPVLCCWRKSPAWTGGLTSLCDGWWSRARSIPRVGKTCARANCSSPLFLAKLAGFSRDKTLRHLMAESHATVVGTGRPPAATERDASGYPVGDGGRLESRTA